MAAAAESPGRILWVEAKRGYAIALHDGRLATHNAQGGPLASVPRWLKDSEQGQQLQALCDWLVEQQLAVFKKLP